MELANENKLVKLSWFTKDEVMEEWFHLLMNLYHLHVE